MLNLVKAIIVIALLALPLLVITEFPRFLELAGSIPVLGSGATGSTPTPTFRLTDATPTPRGRFAQVVETPPPTLTRPAPASTQAATPRPSPTGERIVIGNTDGAGAVLRADPVTGAPVGSLRDGLTLDVLERRAIAGSGDWVRVRTADGREGWVTGLAALPVKPSQ